MINRRLLFAGGASFFACEANSAPRPDLGYAPQFIVGRNRENIADIFVSLTCVDSFRAYSSTIAPFIRQNVAGGHASVVFHNLVRNDRDLEFSADVLAAAPGQYGALCLALLAYGAKQGKALARDDIPQLMRHLRITRRGGFSRSKAQQSLALMNKYARENLRVSSTPTYMKNGSSSWSL